MSVNVVDFSASVLDSFDLNPNIFSLEVSPIVISQAINWNLAKRRSGCHSAKTISFVSGTTRKPYRQKGTGRARQGSLRSPQFRGGARIFPPIPRSHAFRLNKKIRSLALKMSLSSKNFDHKIYVLEDDCQELTSSDHSFVFSSFKSSVSLFKASSILLVCNVHDVLKKSSSSLSYFNVLPPIGLNVYDIMKSDFILITKSSCQYLNQRFS